MDAVSYAHSAKQAKRITDLIRVGELEPASVELGTEWYVPTTGKTYKRINDGSNDVWVDINSSGANAAIKQSEEFIVGTASGNYDGSSLNTFPIQAGYYPEYVLVTLNGRVLAKGDFTATDGYTIVLSSDAANTDIIEVLAFGTFVIADHYRKAETDNLLGTKADKNGSVSDTFKAAIATSNDEVLPKGQYISLTSKYIKPSNNVLFTKTAPAEFSIPEGFKVTVNDTIVEVTAEATLNLNDDLDTGTKTAGTDYYVYVKADSTFYISADKTITADRLIGGFHYGLTAEDEAKTGNKTDDDMVAIRGINQYSFWDLKFRPVANPEGMVFVGGHWYDIYLLNSEHITNGTSKAGAVIAGGATDNGRGVPKIPLAYGGDGDVDYGKFTWFQACEIAKSHGKELIDYAEFPTIAYGVDEGKSSDDYETTAGKIEHYSHLTSKFGIEQATGAQHIWGKDVGGNRDEDSTSWGWRDKADARGQIYALNDKHITAVLLGATRGSGAHAGSRASYWSSYVWSSSWSIGSRFACEGIFE